MKPNVKLSINAIIETINFPTGKVTKRTEVHNLVVDTGLDEFVDTGLSTFGYMAIGIDNTAPTAGDVALGDEIKREAVSPTDEGNGIREYDFTFTFATGESYDITEYGIFDGAIPTGSIMLNRLVDGGHEVDIDNGVRVRITFTVVAA